MIGAWTSRSSCCRCPVSDVDAAIAFYTERAGFTLDHDHRVTDALRFVQITPPGSACSIAFGEGITEAAPGSHPGIQAVIADPDDNPWALQQPVVG